MPVPSTSFVGRITELAEVTALISEQRLVTDRTRGVGKTRLAIAASDRLRGGFPEGTWWIDLATASDAGTVVPTIARALGVVHRPDPDLLGVVCRALARKRVVLVIDNCERVAPAVAETLARILPAAPSSGAGDQPFAAPARGGAAVARSRLACAADAGLSGPPDAVMPFAERARAADPVAAAHPDTPADVAELCQRLDGLPLAIEMAASRSTTLSPRAMLALLEQRLALLHSSATDVPDRHHSLGGRAGLVLREAQRSAARAFDRACVLVGPFDLAAAADIACQTGDPLAVSETMTALQNVALLSPERLGQDRGFRSRVRARLRPGPPRGPWSARGGRTGPPPPLPVPGPSAGEVYGTPEFAGGRPGSSCATRTFGPP